MKSLAESGARHLTRAHRLCVQNEQGGNRLGKAIRRKQIKIEKILEEMGMEAVEERLQTATSMGPGSSPFKFAHLVQNIGGSQGRPALIFELYRSNESETSESMAQRARKLIDGGADAISVRIDDTDEGMLDLWTVSQAVSSSVPLFCRDWFLHPIQIVDVKSSGCSGIIGVACSVLGKGAPLMSSFSSALGLDCPVEVVNMSEMKSMEEFRVPFYSINTSVRLSVPITGFSDDIVNGILGDLPFGSISLVGVDTAEKSRQARLDGADALYIRHDLVDLYAGEEGTLTYEIMQATNGDD